MYTIFRFRYSISQCARANVAQCPQNSWIECKILVQSALLLFRRGIFWQMKSWPISVPLIRTNLIRFFFGKSYKTNFRQNKYKVKRGYADTIHSWTIFYATILSTGFFFSYYIQYYVIPKCISSTGTWWASFAINSSCNSGRLDEISTTGWVGVV